jgi:hypothetical protein
LIAKEDDLIAVESGFDRRDIFVGQILAQVDAMELGAHDGVQRRDRNGAS